MYWMPMIERALMDQWEDRIWRSPVSIRWALCLLGLWSPGFACWRKEENNLVNDLTFWSFLKARSHLRLNHKKPSTIGSYDWNKHIYCLIRGATRDTSITAPNQHQKIASPVRSLIIGVEYRKYWGHNMYPSKLGDPLLGERWGMKTDQKYKSRTSVSTGELFQDTYTLWIPKSVDTRVCEGAGS